MNRRSSVGFKQVVCERRGSRFRRESSLPVRFELDRLGARKVSLVGSFNHWRRNGMPMVDFGGGHWVVEVPLPPGRHEYFFVADGVRIADPLASRYERNPNGGLNSILHI